MNNKMRVLVISPQFLLRQGVEHILDSEEDFEVIGASQVDETLLTGIDTLHPT